MGKGRRSRDFRSWVERSLFPLRLRVRIVLFFWLLFSFPSSLAPVFHALTDMLIAMILLLPAALSQNVLLVLTLPQDVLSLALQVLVTLFVLVPFSPFRCGLLSRWLLLRRLSILNLDPKIRFLRLAILGEVSLRLRLGDRLLSVVLL